MSSPSKAPSSSVSYFQQIVMMIGISLLLATIFTAWTPPGRITDNISDQLAKNGETVVAFQPPAGDYPTPTPRPRPRLGLVAGHWGNDAGAVCDDGFTEAELNLTVATLAKQRLMDAGFDVDLLEEFDSRLGGYRGLALVSIHADSCNYVNDQATGFKVAAALSTKNQERATRLTACLRARYAENTGLAYHSGSITSDMTDYHAFGEINDETTAAIIEIGFMNLDRQTLTQSPQAIADGITDGILCFIHNEDLGD